jgi:type IX secretion system PorP/SprF family membrane protein
MAYRNQWPRIQNTFQTVAVSADAPFFFGGRERFPRHGLGLSLMSDQAGAGVLTKIYATFNYSFLIPLGRRNDQALRFGIAGGVQQASIDFFRLRFPNQFGLDGFDPTVAVPELAGIQSNNRMHEQINAGLVYSHKRFYIGASAFNITQPEQALLPNGTDPIALPMRINAFTGVNIPLNRVRPDDGPSLSPAFMFRNQGPFTQVDLGMYANLKPIVIGTWYRLNDAVIGVIGLQQGIFSFGYSYDYTISNLTNSVSGGAHEVSVTVTLEGPTQRGRRPSAKMSCPRF